MNTENTEEDALIQQDRLHQITEVGIIDGGIWADVLAICYGEQDRCVRVRFEKTGENVRYTVPEGVSLKEMLRAMAIALDELFPYFVEPSVTVHQGGKAQQWVSQTLESVRKKAAAGEEGKVRIAAEVSSTAI